MGKLKISSLNLIISGIYNDFNEIVDPYKVAYLNPISLILSKIFLISSLVQEEFFIELSILINLFFQ